MLLKISHKTHYRYEAPNDFALQQQRMTPQTGPGQTVRRWETVIDGGRKEVEYDDHNGNRVTLVSATAEGHEISVTCDGEIATEDTSGVIGPHHGSLPLWYFNRVTELTAPGPRVRALVADLATPADGDIARMHLLSANIVALAPYRSGSTHTGTSAEQVLEEGAGVCQDHAHVFLSAARLLGFPARYVSGYLMMQDRVDQDATHAWAEVHVVNLGWGRLRCLQRHLAGLRAMCVWRRGWTTTRQRRSKACVTATVANPCQSTVQVEQ